MKKFFKVSFLPLLVLLLTFSYLSASEDVIFEQEVNEGDLLIYFVNELKEYVHIPSSIIFSFVEVSSQDQESTAVLGTDQETIRVDNATSGEVELTASLDVTNFLEDAKWLDGENSYLAYSEDEGISGGLELDPVVSLIETQGCEEEVVSRGSTSRFTPTTSESIDIFTTTGGQYCRYDLTGIDLTQTIPGRTPAGNYSLDMVLTLTGGSKWIPEYTLEYIAGDNGSIIGESLQTVSYSEDGSEVTADPDTDYHFLMWSDLREDNPRIDTNVTEDISVEAIFESESNPYFLNAYSSPSLGGSVEIQGDTEGLFYHEDEATVIASTSPGYEFIGWSDSNEIVSESSTYVFTMTGNRTLVAEFELEEYELTIISGSGGSTEPSSGVHTYTYGQEVIVYSLPEVDYEFTGWSGDCVGLGDCNLTMTEDKSVSANFEMSLEPQNLHVVSYTSSSGGSVLPSLRVVSSGGTSSSPNVSTNPSYEFVNFSITVGSGNGELNVETGEVTDVQGDMTIQANFTSFDPCEGEGSIEIGGKSYSLVGIGNQCWMQENLNYSGHSSGQSWCYGNNSSNCDTYGRLYNWEAAVTACPSGTTLPTDEDWQELEEYLGMSKTQSSGLRWRGVNEEIGNKLKTVGWGSGTNSSIFTALPGGWRYFYGGSGHVNVWWDLGNTHLSRGKFWSFDAVDNVTAWYRGLQRDESGVHRWPQNKGDGYSVRCLFKENISGEVSIPCGEDLVDVRDDSVYPTVKIGTQCWMQANLNYSNHVDGESWCYENNINNCETYGRLYNWDAAVDEDEVLDGNTITSVQGSCPEGWSVPSSRDWYILESYLATDSCNMYRSGASDCEPAGEAMKVTDWGNGTNSSNFMGLPAGYHFSSQGTFNFIGTTAYFWSSSPLNSSAWRYRLSSTVSGVDRSSFAKTNGYSVRCVRNEGVENSCESQQFLFDSRNGQLYSTVEIGNQCWMRENLNYSGHSEGSSWCYDNNVNNCKIYGRLYNWFAAMNGYDIDPGNTITSVLGVCPDGWVLPSDREWYILESYLATDSCDGSRDETFAYDCEPAGSSLKTDTWGNGTNLTGFTGLPSGYYWSGNDSFEHIGSLGYFWTSSPLNANSAFRHRLSSPEEGVSRASFTKNHGYSVRCLKEY
jgi:uncharacterized protein (TIGR02145 family)